MLQGLIVSCLVIRMVSFLDFVLLHANEAKDVSECIPTFLPYFVAVRIFKFTGLGKAGSEFVVSFQSSFPLIVKLDQRDVRVSKESI
jgi:hypothetical protein